MFFYMRAVAIVLDSLFVSVSAIIVGDDVLLELFAGALLVYVGIATIFHVIDNKTVVVVTGHDGVLVPNFNPGLVIADVIVGLSFSATFCTLLQTTAGIFPRVTVISSVYVIVFTAVIHRSYTAKDVIFIMIDII